jgi:spore coat protein CotH
VVSVFRKRRGRGNFEAKYIEPGSEAWVILDQLQRVHDIENHETQAQRYDELFDLDSYMKWLAFNSLVQNADSDDELFLYELREDMEEMGQLKIMAWDYDDLQMDPAHPQYVHEDPLMWAAESQFAVQIIRNPVLYTRYKQVMKQLLTEHLTETHLSQSLAQVKQVLDSIDTGLALLQQTQTRNKRDMLMQQFEVRLLQRRAQLMEQVKN